MHSQCVKNDTPPYISQIPQEPAFLLKQGKALRPYRVKRALLASCILLLGFPSWAMETPRRRCSADNTVPRESYSVGMVGRLFGGTLSWPQATGKKIDKPWTPEVRHSPVWVNSSLLTVRNELYQPPSCSSVPAWKAFTTFNPSRPQGNVLLWALAARMQDIEKQKQHLQDENGGLQAINGKLEDENTRLKSEISVLSGKIGTLEQQLADLLEVKKNMPSAIYNTLVVINSSPSSPAGQKASQPTVPVDTAGLVSPSEQNVTETSQDDEKEVSSAISSSPCLSTEEAPYLTPYQERVVSRRSAGQIGDKAWELLADDNKQFAAELLDAINENPGINLDLVDSRPGYFKLSIEGQEDQEYDF